MEKKSGQNSISSSFSSNNKITAAASAAAAATEAQDERLNQIVHIDTNALLKTIRDLEYKLSEHQRQDLKPAWAVSLESRMDILERSPVSLKSEPKADKYPLSENKEPGLSMHELTVEERILTKMRSEFENKIELTKLNYDSKIGSFTLEIDRLHKLLAIRPTTSELQQVIFSVQDVERRTKDQVDEMKRDVKTTVDEQISNEMTVIQESIKASKSLNEASIQRTHRQVNDYATDIAGIRNAADSSFSTMQSEIARLKEEALESEQRNAAIRSELEKSLAALTGQISGLSEKQDAASELLRQKTEELVSTIGKLEEKLLLEHQQMVQENMEINEKITLSNMEMQKAAESLDEYKTETGFVLEAIKLDQGSLENKLEDQIMRLSSTKATVQELVDQDFGGKISLHDDQFDKVNGDITDMKADAATAAIEAKSMISRIHHVEDICDIKIPQVYAEQTRHIEKLYDSVAKLNENLSAVRSNAEGLSDLVDTLVPLTKQVQTLEVMAAANAKEVKSLTETVTRQIDASDEMARRLEELEEKVEAVDESITNRMNRIRDTLMDALLEKQSETAKVVRNVKENLEVMAGVGDNLQLPNVSNINHNEPKRLGKFNAKSTSNLDITGNTQDGPNLGGQRGRKPSQGEGYTASPSNFKRPTISGAMVKGTPPPVVARQVSSKGMGGAQNLGAINETPTSARSDGTSSHGQAQQPNAQLTAQSPASKQSVIRPSSSSQHPPMGIDRALSEELDLDTANSSRQGTSTNLLAEESAFTADPALTDDIHPQSSFDEEADDSNGEFEGVTAVRAQHSAPSQSVVSYGTNDTEQFRGPESSVTASAAMEYNDILGGSGGYQFQQQAQYLSDLCVNYENISFKKRRVTFIPPVMCENIALVTQQIAEIMANGSDYDMVYNVMCQGSNLQSVAEITYDENFVLRARQNKMEQYMQAVTYNVHSSGSVAGIVRQNARTLFLSLIKKALEMFMSKHNQVLVVGNSRLGRVKIPSCIACDRPLLEKVRLDSVVNSSLNGGSSVARSAGLGVMGGFNNSMSSQWGAENSDEEGGQVGFSGLDGGNSNSLVFINIHNNNQPVGGGSVVSARGSGSRGSDRKSQKERTKSSLVKLPNALFEGNRPRSSQGGSEPYVLRGGFKMPRPTTSGDMMTSHSTPHLPDVHH